MSSAPRPGPMLALPPGQSLLFLPQKASSPSMSAQPATAMTAACRQKPAADPLVLERLTVWDPEEEGNRHWDETTQTLHIVQKEAVDHVRITYTGPDIPAKLQVWRNDTLLPDLTGSGDWTAEVTYATLLDPYDSDNTSANPLAALFTASSPVCRYRFVAPQFTVHVHVYNPDQWKLKLTVPAMKSQSFSREGQFGSSALTYKSASASAALKDGKFVSTAKDVEITTSPDGKAARSQVTETKTRVADGAITITKAERDKSYTARSSRLINVGWQDGQYAVLGKGKGRPNAKGEGKSKDKSTGLAAATQFVSLECNGRVWPVDAMIYIGSALLLARTLYRLREMIKQNVPEIGWCWDVSWKVLEGELELEWGWREDKGKAVYYGVGVSASLTLIEVKGSIGVGVSIARNKAQALLELSGSVKLQAGPVVFNRPAEEGAIPSIDLAKVKGELEFTAKLLFELRSVLTVEGGAKATLLSVDGAIKAGGKEGLCAEVDVKFDGVKLFLSAKSRFITKRAQEGEVVLLDPKPIGKFTYPQPQALGTDELKTLDAVAEAAEAALSEGWFPVRFEDKTSYVVHEKEFVVFGDVVPKAKDFRMKVPTKDVAKEIAAKIWARKDRLDLRGNTVEGIVLGLRDQLALEGNPVPMTRLRQMLESAVFAQTLTKAECPVKCCMADNGLTADPTGAGATASW